MTEPKPTAATVWQEYKDLLRGAGRLDEDDVILLRWLQPRWDGDFKLLLDYPDGLDLERVSEILWQNIDIWQALPYNLDFGLGESYEPDLDPGTPSIEFLDDAPKALRRPLALLDGTAYVTTWTWTKATITETRNKKGEVVQHNPPIVQEELWPVVLRGDGKAFSKRRVGDVSPFAKLGLAVKLPETPRHDRLLSASAMKRYMQGYRPEKADVFNRVADVVDRFVDFDRSLTDQRAMSELMACYILATYFLPAFNVFGYIWPNGERGCGKTHLLVTICELAYLGSVILAGSTYPTLRDLADYGATLAFDDAEEIMDSKKTDPDKRTLLLAGNRRGAMIAVKEQVGYGQWQTRHVDAFCPRLFSAIRLPDPVLGSRTIVIPLLRTLDRAKGNADPLDYSLWPHDRQALVDDLWLLALAHLPELSKVDHQVAERTTLTGRALDPWRAILAVALWLDEGMFTRLDGLSVNYQKEKRELETTDLSTLCVQAMLELAGCDDSDDSDDSDNNVVRCVFSFLEPCHFHPQERRPGDSNNERCAFPFTVAELSEIITKLAKEADRHDGTEPFASRQRIGYALTRLRVPNKRESGGKRYREIRCDDLKRLAMSYGLLSSLSSQPSLLSQEAEKDTRADKPSVNSPSDPLIEAAQALGGVVKEVIVLEDGTQIPF